MPAIKCTHLDQIKVEHVPSREETPGCEACLQTGSTWVHLRMCRTCGRVGCCDSSPQRHARRHASEAGHPVISSIEPGENWSWCFIDDHGFVISAS